MIDKNEYDSAENDDSLHYYRRLLLIVIIIGWSFALASDGRAQETIYGQHDYMEVPAGQTETYLDLERNVWKPIHRQRIEDGTIIEWHLFEVVYPVGAERSHDYVTVSFYDSWADLETPLMQEHIEKAHPEKDPQDILQQTFEARSRVQTEVVEIVDTVTGENTESEVGIYLAVDYMRIPEGGQSAYVQMEQDLWKPIHRELIEQTSQTSWYLVERQFVGAEAPYQFMTIRSFTDWNYLNPSAPGNPFQTVAEAAHPNTPFNEIGAQTRDTRTLIRSEIWRMIDTVEPAE